MQLKRIDKFKESTKQKNSFNRRTDREQDLPRTYESK